MREIVIVPTYKRPEMLFYCLSLIRAFEKEIPVAIFPDRGTAEDPELVDVVRSFEPDRMVVQFVPEHDYYGNSYNVMEALRWAYSGRWDRVFYIEDDVMVHPDFFEWHRKTHAEFDDIFASMGWVFNHHAPITDDLQFQPWYYAIGTCFSREKLGLVARHATPRYYNDMPGYIEKNFKASTLNARVRIEHFEQDGLIQRILDVDKSQTAASGIARCTHIGTFGYNRGWDIREDFFEGCPTFEDRVGRLRKLVGDPYWRAEIFSRAIVEREIGHVLPKRERTYTVRVGPYESEFKSELGIDLLPKRINSVPRTSEMEIVINS